MPCIPCCHKCRGKRERLPACGACSIHSKPRNTEVFHTKCCGHRLSEQISCKYIVHVGRIQMCFSKGHCECISLHGALCFFPRILPKPVIFSYNIKQTSKRSVRLLCAYNRTAFQYKRSLRKTETPLSQFLLHTDSPYS